MIRRTFLTCASAALASAPLEGFARSHDPDLGPGVGIIFIAAGWCPVCKNAAPVLAAMTEPVNIPVLVVSQDGRPIPPFPGVTDGSAHPIALEVKALPTTLIFSQNLGDLTAQIVGYKNARHYARSIQHAILSTLNGD